MIDKGSPALNHFTRLAAKGSRRGASTYERAAWRIVEAMAAGVNGFDSQATQGLADFAADMANAPRAVLLWVEALRRRSDL